MAERSLGRCSRARSSASGLGPSLARYAGSGRPMVRPFHWPSSSGPGRHRISQNERSHFEKNHMMSSWAPDRMNSCMSWRLFQMVIVQNSVGLAMMLAHSTTSPVPFSCPRTRRVATGSRIAPRPMPI